MISYFVWYLAIGVLCIFGTALVHMMQAEKRGYNAIEWWNEFSDSFDLKVDINFAIGLLIWPIRCYEFIVHTVPDLYELYEPKE